MSENKNITITNKVENTAPAETKSTRLTMDYCLEQISYILDDIRHLDK